MVCICIEYDVTNYFRSKVILKKNHRKCRLRRLGSNFSRTVKAMITKLSKPIGDYRPHKPAGYDSGRLQNAIKYCTNVRKMGPAGQRVE